MVTNSEYNRRRFKKGGGGGSGEGRGKGRKKKEKIVKQKIYILKCKKKLYTSI